MNIFWAITSGLQWYDALSRTKVWSDIIGKAKQIASPITSAVQPVKETLSKVSQPYADIWSSIVKWMATPQKTTFFSDEQSAYDKMIADNIPEADAIQAIKSRRQDLMWWNTGITSFEQSALKKMQADWVSAKEASQMLIEHRKEMEQEAKKKYEAMGTGEKLVKWAVWAWLGALSTIWSSSENILGWWAKKLGFDQLWNELQQQAKEYSKAWENVAQDQAYSTGVKTGNIIGGAGMMLAAWWPTGIIWKWEWLLSSIATPWSLIAKNAGLISKVAGWAAWWAVQWAWVDIANNWETSLWSTLKSAALWWSLPIVWKTFEALSKIPVSKIIPTTPSQAWKDISRWLEIWKAIRDTGFSLTKWSLIKKVESKVWDLSWKIDDAINTVIKTEWPKNITMNWITKWIKESILKDPVLAKKLQGTPIDMKDIEEWMNETITAYKKLYGAKKLDLNAQQQLKKDIYNWLSSTFSKADTAKLSARQVVEKQLAKTLKEWIEKSVPEVAELNKKLAPYMEAGKRLKAKWWYSWYLTDIIAGWFASWNPSSILEDPVWYAKNFATWVIAKRLWTSTAAKTWSAQILKWIEKVFESPSFQKIIINQASQLNNQ